MPLILVINILIKKNQVEEESNEALVVQELQLKASLLKVPTAPIINQSLAGKRTKQQQNAISNVLDISMYGALVR